VPRHVAVTVNADIADSVARINCDCRARSGRYNFGQKLGVEQGAVLGAAELSIA